jgi:hypothetical protein
MGTDTQRMAQADDGEQIGSVMNPDSCYGVQMVEQGYTGGDRNERCAANCIQEADRFDGVSIMIGARYLTPGGLNWCMSTVH